MGACVCIFLSADQRRAQIDIHFGSTFSFYILSRSEQWEGPEDMKEQESAGEKSTRKTFLSVRTFILCLLKFFFSHILRSGEEELSY